MDYRKLGKTGLEVGEIGLGTEYLNGQPRTTVRDTVREAVSKGINYIDILFSFREYRESLGEGLEGIRRRVIIAGHLGCAESNGQYRKTRDIAENRALFSDLLGKLHTRYIDVVFVQFVDEEEDYQKVMGSGGLRDLAEDFRQKGRAKFIGLSSHEATIAMKAVQSGKIDVLMFPVNIAWDSLPGRRDLFRECSRRGVGLVAMKPYIGGKIFTEKSPPTPPQCLNYVLSQQAVATAVPGVKNQEELRSALTYVTADESEKDYTEYISRFQDDVGGTCVYCNHCLPCPAGIDIGRTLRIADAAEGGSSSYLASQYSGLPQPASQCTECGACVKRCPFGVEVIVRMRETAKRFE